MSRKYWLVLLLVLSLLLVLVPACGDDDEEAPVVTATPVPKGPVKIGAITSWTGPAAASGTNYGDPIIQLVEKQVKDMGGILGGREVKIVKYDNRMSVAEAQAGCMKLLYDDKVSAIVWGGVSGAESEAIAAFAQENKILLAAFGAIKQQAANKFFVNCTSSTENLVAGMVSLGSKVLKLTKVAFLCIDTADYRDRFASYKKGLEAAGVKTVYEQYFPPGTVDFLPYLTKVKYEKPEGLVFAGATDDPLTLVKQIMEIGGWGDIKVLGEPGAGKVVGMPGGDGWYMMVPWVPGMEYPGSVKFANEYQAMHGKAPVATHAYYYNCLWTAISAIVVAGTDTDLVRIAEVARSGLEWESPMGRTHFAADGSSGLSYAAARVEGSKLVPVTLPK